jgi:hypothetical protein
MKKFISLFLVCFLVIAISGAGTLKASVIEKDVAYIDVGLDASIDAIAFENVAVATQAEVSIKVCSNTTAIGCYAEAVTVKSVPTKPTTETHLLVYKVPWRFKTKRIYYAKAFGDLGNGNLRQPRDGLTQVRNS